MGEEQSTVSGGGGPREARLPGGGSAGQPESPRPRGDRTGAAGPRAASSEPGGGGCADASAQEPASRRATAGRPAGLPLAGPLDPHSLQLRLEREPEGAGPREAPPGQQPPDGLLLDALAQRPPPPAKPQVFCSVYCVESDLPEAPSAESSPESPPRVLPGPIPASPPSSFPSSPLSLAADPLSPDGGSIELEFYLAPEPFSVPGLLGAPPYSGLGGVGDPYAPLMVLMCRVCLEDKPIKPLPCCKKAVCEECLKIYLSSQVTSTVLSAHSQSGSPCQSTGVEVPLQAP
nr:probable E3 ubiquitin-protein ligase RNF217 [Meriones unguiculatus]